MTSDPPTGEPQRMALFVDAGYLDKLCQDLFATQRGGRKAPLALDYKRLGASLAGDCPWRTFYYHCLPWLSEPPLPAEHATREAKQRFLDFVARQRGWVLREGVLERRGQAKGESWYEQKRVDVALAVDLVRLAWRGEIARAVLLAGDSDFVPAVLDARAAGVHVTLRYAHEVTHADLIAACDVAIPLTRAEMEAIALAPPPGV